MHMWCERISALLAGMLVGAWYTKTYPLKKAEDLLSKAKKKF